MGNIVKIKNIYFKLLYIWMKVKTLELLNICRLGESELLHFHDCKCRRKRGQITCILISTLLHCP